MKNKKGFTLIEILVVIIVIGILATLTVVSYNSVQERARDAKRKSDLNVISTAFVMYHATSKTWVLTGTGAGGLGTGFFSDPYSTKSIAQGLIGLNYLSGEFTDPQANKTDMVHKYDVAMCANGGLALYAHLETPSADDTKTFTDAVDSTSAGLYKCTDDTNAAANWTPNFAIVVR